MHQEAFVLTFKKRTESIQEHDLWVDGEYMSEKDMVDDGYDASSGKPVKSIYLRKSYEVTVECDLLVPIYYKSCRLLRDLRSRILAIKAECKRNKGWIKCQACIQALQVVDI